jgi:hypothetical protein
MYACIYMRLYGWMHGSINANMCSCESLCVVVLKYDSSPPVIIPLTIRILFCSVVVWCVSEVGACGAGSGGHSHRVHR